MEQAANFNRPAEAAPSSSRHVSSAAFHRHDQKVARVCAELAARVGSQPISLRKKSPPHQVPKGADLRRRDDKIDISDLNEVLLVDVPNRLCVAEPGVTFIDLVRATLPHGLVPIVVPELKTITIGGAVSGCSLESMSFRYGGFHDTCTEYEVITSDGRLLRCTPDNEHSHVFEMVHGSFGTLGIVAKLTFRLVPAKRYVKMTYEKHHTLESYQAAITRYSKDASLDFMDGIIHAPDLYVLSLGHFVDQAPYTHRYDWMRIYYRSTKERSEDYLETEHYFFRYDRGVTNVRPSSFLGRLFFGKIAHSTNLLWAAERVPWLLRWLEGDNPKMTLDVFLPYSNLPPFFEWYNREIGFYPLWCVPYKRRDYGWINPQHMAGITDDLFVDIAIYGLPPAPGKNYHKMMEQKLLELGGIKTLIAHNYYTREEFWCTWNKPNYDKAKAITDPLNRFRGVYEKTCEVVMGKA